LCFMEPPNPHVFNSDQAVISYGKYLLTQIWRVTNFITIECG